ncbi:MAG: ABC transporter ATP-binding protein [Alphaproteobacteria bacterium]|mgnify:CR=1 FL=1|nr:ABC transporter ATP-binding protein [Alphaproteobacteria bacterium]
MDLAVSDLRKRFGAVEALQGITLEVQSGEFFAILGPSGAGKTTLLRTIAGIERPDGGRVMLGGRNVADVPVRDRNTAMVFQTFALYPHLSTFDNLAYPLREARVPAAEVKRRVGEVAEMLRLTHTLARKPATLSGGEQQRCAIGRALVRRPQLLLLDEPLTNLDAKLRHDTRAEFKRLHRELGSTTIVYATPDQLEALSMGSRVGVLRQGRIVQVDAPATLYTKPDDAFVASLVGDPPINLVPGTLHEDGGGRRIELDFMGLDAQPWRKALAAFSAGTRLRVGLRPQAIWPAAGETQGAGFGARVFLTEPLGDVTILDVMAHGDTRLRMVLPQEQAWQIAVDDTIECAVDVDQICLFAEESGVALHRDRAETAG